MPRTVRFLVAVLGLTALFAVCYVAATFAPVPDLHPLRSKVIELTIGGVAAIGTLAAVVVAMYLGFDGQRRADRAEDSRTKFVAARVFPLVADIAAKIDTAVLMAETEGFQDGGSLLNFEFSRFGPLVNALHVEDLQALMQLPDHVGGRLASCVAQLRLVMSEYHGPANSDEVRFNDALAALDKLRPDLEWVRDRLYQVAAGAAPKLDTK